MKKSGIGKIAIVAVLIVLILLFVDAKIKDHSIAKQLDDANYISYQVQPGDTLWDIAEEVNKFDMTTSDYVETLMEINGLKSDFIQQGSHLVIAIPSK